MPARKPVLSVPLFCLLLFSIACQLISGSPGSSPIVSETPRQPGMGSGPAGPIVTPAESGTPPEVLRAVFKHMSALTSYRMKVISQVGENTQTTLIERVAPDRMHMTIVGASEAINAEFVIIGEKIYVKGPGGKWNETPALGTAAEVARRADFSEQVFTNISNIRKVGPDTLDGAAMMVYSYHSDLGASGLDFKLWVGAADGLAHQMESVGEAVGRKFKTTTEFYDFEAPIVIQVPVP